MNAAESDLLKSFIFWTREKHDAMISIIGFTDLLLDHKVGNLSDQQQEFIHHIRSAATKTAQSLRSNKDYLKLRYQAKDIHWKREAVNLSDVLENALSSTCLYINRANTAIEASSQTPLVRADSQWLRTALINLIEPSPEFFYQKNIQATVRILQVDSLSVRVQIHSTLILEPEHTHITSIACSGNCFDLASRILQKHGSELMLYQFSHSGNRLALFEFTLPVWKGRQKRKTA